MTSPNHPSTDPNVSAHAVVEAATGTTAGAPVLPPHVTIADRTASCATCGKTFVLSKREGERAAVPLVRSQPP